MARSRKENEAGERSQVRPLCPQDPLVVGREEEEEDVGCFKLWTEGHGKDRVLGRQRGLKEALSRVGLVLSQG